MLRKLIGLTLIITIVGISSAQAGIEVVVTPLEGVPPFQAPDAALTGFTAYQVDVSSDDESKITALDAFFNGLMHQRWSDTNFDGVADPTPNGPASNGRGDSHLVMVAGGLVGSAPTENNNVSDSPLPDNGFDYGQGDSLAGAWGIPGPSQTVTATAAYLVIADGAMVEFTGSVATANGTFDIPIGNGGTEGWGIGAIPEPGSIALSCIGLVGLAIRRRRTC